MREDVVGPDEVVVVVPLTKRMPSPLPRSRLSSRFVPTKLPANVFASLLAEDEDARVVAAADHVAGARRGAADHVPVDAVSLDADVVAEAADGRLVLIRADAVAEDPVAGAALSMSTP